MRWGLSGFLILLVSCSGSSGGAEKHGEGEHVHQHGEIHLEDGMVETLGLGVHVVDSGYIVKRRKYPAEVVRSYEGVATVRARFPGIVLKIYVKPGDRVGRGQVVARIESDESFTAYRVVAPISGIVSRIMVTEGVVVERGVPLLEITDPSKIWVRAMVWPAEVDFVKEGKEIVFHRHFGDSYREAEGRIFFVAPYLDSTTRMIPVMAYLYESRGLRPGMYGDIIVSDSHRVNLMVPLSAVHVVDGDTLVFLAEGERAHPVRVSLGISDGENVEVVSGLEAGDTVFSENSFLLRAEMEKEIWMGGHGHVH